MNVQKAVEITAVMLMPTAAVGGLVYGWTAFARIRRFRLERRARIHPLASRAPIEVEAARLRRMLQRREELLASAGSATRTHLVALESAIADSASDLADAVGVERPQHLPSSALPEGELPALLGRLADAGIVLPPTSLRS
jgi:hypothetical protein